MGDLDIRFSGENDNKDLNSSLNLRLNNGQFEEVLPEEPKPSVNEILNEEYYENLLDIKPVEAYEEAEEDLEISGENIGDAEDDEILYEEDTAEGFEEYSEEIPQEEDFYEFEEDDGADDLVEVTSQLKEEFFEEIEAENTDFDEDITEEVGASEDFTEEVEEVTEGISEKSSEEEEIPETEEEISEVTDASEETEAEVSAQEEPVDWYEKALVSGANEVDDNPNPTDEKLGELSFDTQKGKFDFVNLCVLALMIIFVSLTFILMKQTLVNDKKAELSLETIKTGEYTKEFSENYEKNLPLQKLMAQAEVLVKKIFGDRDVKFIKFNDSEPPDGPVDNDNIGGMTVDDEEGVVTTASGGTTQVTTTAKLPQDFEITTSSVKTDKAPVFTGRPIKTTTTKVTTTLDLPKTTKDTTTGKVNLIFP
ncbi:MAG: hypothetical protein E7509_03620 [Ruminococcus sp.]|nr:hypothetical protein [Ruminococcus sp.]